MTFSGASSDGRERSLRSPKKAYTKSSGPPAVKTGRSSSTGGVLKMESIVAPALPRSVRTSNSRPRAKSNEGSPNASPCMKDRVVARRISVWGTEDSPVVTATDQVHSHIRCVPHTIIAEHRLGLAGDRRATRPRFVSPARDRGQEESSRRPHRRDRRSRASYTAHLQEHGRRAPVCP